MGIIFGEIKSSLFFMGIIFGEIKTSFRVCFHKFSFSKWL